MTQEQLLSVEEYELSALPGYLQFPRRTGSSEALRVYPTYAVGDGWRVRVYGDSRGTCGHQVERGQDRPVDTTIGRHKPMIYTYPANEYYAGLYPRLAPSKFSGILSGKILGVDYAAGEQEYVGKFPVVGTTMDANATTMMEHYLYYSHRSGPYSGQPARMPNSYYDALRDALRPQPPPTRPSTLIGVAK